MFYVEASRDDVLRCFPRGGSLAEVGVFMGTFSRQIVDVVTPERLDLIDVWKWTYFDWNNPPALEHDNVEHFRAWAKGLDPGYDGGHPDVMLERFYHNLLAWGQTETRSKILLHKGRSLDVVKSLPDAGYDLIYVDADHHYDTVLADLMAYSAKLKPGGLLMGDDFLEDLSRTDGLYGTIDAVNTFIKRTDFRPLVITGPGACQFLLYREMSDYVDMTLSNLLTAKSNIVEVNDALLGRFVQRKVRTRRMEKLVPSFL